MSGRWPPTTAGASTTTLLDATYLQDVQAGDEGEHVQMQRRGYRPVIGWRRNGHLVHAQGRCHGAPPGRGSKPRSWASYLTSLGWETPSLPIQNGNRVAGADRARLPPTSHTWYTAPQPESILSRRVHECLASPPVSFSAYSFSDFATALGCTVAAASRPRQCASWGHIDNCPLSHSST